MLAALSIVAGQTSGPRVELSLIVVQQDNRPIDTIRKEDVHVFEGKVEQTILSVKPDTRPVDLAMAIDCSGSFRKSFAAATDAARAIIRSARPEDEIFIEKFVTGEVEKVHDFSRDTKSLLKMVDQLYIEGGQSAVVDGIYMAVQYVADHDPSRADRRKAVVVITDGEDRNSYYRAEGLLQLARAHDVQVFLLGLTSDLKSTTAANKPGPRERAETLLKLIARETAGRAFFPANHDDLLLNAVPQVVSDLRKQFVITYQSSDDSAKQGFRLVEVTVDQPAGEKWTVVAPHAYYFPIGSAAPIEREKP